MAPALVKFPAFLMKLPQRDRAGIEDPPGTVGDADSGGCSAPHGNSGADGGVGIADAGEIVFP